MPPLMISSNMPDWMKPMADDLDQALPYEDSETAALRHYRLYMLGDGNEITTARTCIVRMTLPSY
jgi:hypothetical protein